MVTAPQLELRFADTVRPGEPPCEELALDWLEEELSRWHRGREQAVTIEALANTLRWSRRTVHDLISKLVLERRMPVGTTSGGKGRKPGVFWIVDEADRRAALGNLLPRALRILKRYHVLSGVSADQLAGQVRMELDAEENG
ncbi:MAG: hypothetical protein JRG73_21095 [Deltaproteobacteria bacterium]|nr:hypothetical protein [Deltaproteobacteria bacterium]